MDSEIEQLLKENLRLAQDKERYADECATLIVENSILKTRLSRYEDVTALINLWSVFNADDPNA